MQRITTVSGEIGIMQDTHMARVSVLLVCNAVLPMDCSSARHVERMSVRLSTCAVEGTMLSKHPYCNECVAVSLRSFRRRLRADLAHKQVPSRPLRTLVTDRRCDPLLLQK